MRGRGSEKERRADGERKGDGEGVETVRKGQIWETVREKGMVRGVETEKRATSI